MQCTAYRMPDLALTSCPTASPTAVLGPRVHLCSLCQAHLQPLQLLGMPVDVFIRQGRLIRSLQASRIHLAPGRGYEEVGLVVVQAQQHAGALSSGAPHAEPPLQSSAPAQTGRHMALRKGMGQAGRQGALGVQCRMQST